MFSDRCKQSRKALAGCQENFFIAVTVGEERCPDLNMSGDMQSRRGPRGGKGRRKQRQQPYMPEDIQNGSQEEDASQESAPENFEDEFSDKVRVLRELSSRNGYPKNRPFFLILD